MAYILSKRKYEKLSHDGYVYTKDKIIGVDKCTISWRCELKDTCIGRVYTALDKSNVIVKKKHNHDTSAANIEVQRTVTAIKRRAVETLEIPSQIIAAETVHLSVASLGTIQHKYALHQIIKRARKEGNTVPAQPMSIAAIEIPASYRLYEYTPGQFENFLIADSGVGDENRILIFGRKSVETWIAHVEKVYVDGTFSLAPTLFSQIFAIMAERRVNADHKFVLPIMYALLPNKQQTTYEKMIDMIVQSLPNFHPQAISMDFERGLINAFSTKFPDVEIHGCLFHLVKNIKRKIADEGLITNYNTDADFALSARMIPALAFVPTTRLENALEVLGETLPRELTPVLDYFEDNYVGRMGKNGNRRQAMFQAKTWSVYERTLAGDSRTNNYAEAAHRRLQAEFGVDIRIEWGSI